MKGVYLIKNKLNGKRYVGSSVDIRQRWRQHRHDLNNGKHCCIHLQRSWIQYGESCFEFSVLEDVVTDSVEDLVTVEQRYLDELVHGFDYNCRFVATSNAGIVRGKPSANAVEAARATFIKLWKDPKHREHMSAVATLRYSDPAERNKHALACAKKLNPSSVKEIKILLESGASRKYVAEKFSVSYHTITDIALGRRWEFID